MKTRAKELDRRFDDGEDVTKYLDVSGARKPGRAVKRVNVDFPEWMVQSLDKEARRLGVPRQSIIKVWVAERLAVSRKGKAGPRAVGRRRGRTSGATR